MNISHLRVYPLAKQTTKNKVFNSQFLFQSQSYPKYFIHTYFLSSKTAAHTLQPGHVTCLPLFLFVS